MRILTISALSTALLSSALVGQVGAKPATVTDPNFNADLSASNLSANPANGISISAIGQYELLPLPAGHPQAAPGVYYLTMSAQWTGTGAVGGYDILSGIYDTTQTPPLFTRNTDFDAINTVDDEFQCSLSADLLTAVLDLGSGSSAVGSLCQRGNVTSAFTTATTISGLPSGFVDPHQAMINGQPVVYYIDLSGQIQVADLNYGTSSASNSRLAVDPIPDPDWQFNHSPSTLTHNGEVGAIIHSAYILDSNTGARSDGFFNGIADGTRTEVGHEIITSTNPNHGGGTSGDWIANPDAQGGTLNWANSSSLSAHAYLDSTHMEILAAGGATMRANTAGTLVLRAFAPQAANPQIPQWLGAVAVGLEVPGGIPLPYNGNNLMIDTNSGHVVSSLGIFDPIQGSMEISIPVPALPAGNFLAQVVAIDTTQSGASAVWLGGASSVVFQ